MKTEKPKKGVLITIIILLVIFLPLSILSFVLHEMDKNDPKNNVVENPNHDLYFQGKLYFYDKNDKLLGTYTCKYDENHCKLASNSIDDNLYSLDYYKPEELQIDIIQDRYAFITDSELEIPKVILYDIVNKRTMTTYNSVKNYGIGIEDNLFIVSDADLNFGVLSLESDPSIVISFDYSFLGIANLLNEDQNKIMNDFFVGKKENNWYLVDPNDAVLTDPITREIVSYNGQSIITKDPTGYYLVNYNNKNLLEDESYANLSFTGKYLNILDNYNDFYVYDIGTKQNITEKIHVANKDKITSRITENGKLEIVQNDQVIQTTNINIT